MCFLVDSHRGMNWTCCVLAAGRIRILLATLGGGTCAVTCWSTGVSVRISGEGPGRGLSVPPATAARCWPGAHRRRIRDVDEVNGVAEAAAARKGAVEVDVPVVERVGPSNLRATSHIPLPKKTNFPAGAEVR